MSCAAAVPKCVSPLPTSMQLPASTNTASSAPARRASCIAANPTALSMSSVGFGARDATISARRPKTWTQTFAFPSWTLTIGLAVPET